MCIKIFSNFELLIALFCILIPAERSASHICSLTHPPQVRWEENWKSKLERTQGLR